MKRSLSCLLAIILCFTVLSIQTFAASEQSAVSAASVVSELSALVDKKYPYVWGGKSPDDGGFDCSGLVYYVYNNRLGCDLTYQQVWSRSVPGEKIEGKSSLAAGDIIFGLNDSGGWHTGIYIGNNTMVHAGSSKGVCKTSINGTWFTFKFAIRPSALKQDTSATTTPTTPQAPQVTSSEIDGSWFIYVPANYRLVLYSSATSMSQASYCSPRESHYRVVCSKKATLSNGTTRYYGRFNTNDYYWLTFDDNSGMVMEDASVPGDCTVTFDANGGNVSTSPKIVKMGGTYGELPIPTREGYNFDGWYTASTSIGKKVTESTIVGQTSNQTLYAHWSVSVGTDAKTFKVTLDPFVSCNPFQNSITVRQGETYGSLPTPVATADYLIFDGWYTEKAGGTRINSDTKLVTDGNHTLYAHWTYRYIYVTFDPNGGSFMFSSDSKEHKYTGTEADMAWVIRAGYEFDGWYTEREGGRKITSINVGNGFQWDKSYTLYAHWIKEGQ